MAYEFTKLSSVETVAIPSNNANVLIEEDGVIKKAPKSTVGGGGGGGSSIEPIELELDFDSYYLYFKNLNDFKKVVDNDMTIHLVGVDEDGYIIDAEIPHIGSWFYGYESYGYFWHYARAYAPYYNESDGEMMRVSVSYGIHTESTEFADCYIDYWYAPSYFEILKCYAVPSI